MKFSFSQALACALQDTKATRVKKCAQITRSAKTAVKGAPVRMMPSVLLKRDSVSAILVGKA